MRHAIARWERKRGRGKVLKTVIGGLGPGKEARRKRGFRFVRLRLVMAKWQD